MPAAPRTSISNSPALPSATATPWPSKACRWPCTPARSSASSAPTARARPRAMRIACGLLLPDAGHARIMGYDVVEKPMAVKEHIGYMPQRFSLYPDLTVAENLRFFADLYEVPKAERAARQATADAVQPSRTVSAAPRRSALRRHEAEARALLHADPHARRADPRRTHHRRRSRQPPGVLVHPPRPCRHRPGAARQHSLYGRSPALPPHGAHASRQGAGRRHARRRHCPLHRASCWRSSAPIWTPPVARCARHPCRARKSTASATACTWSTTRPRRKPPCARRLAGMDVEIRSVAPTIEDVFVSLMVEEAPPA